MLLRPTADDVRVIVAATGLALLGLGVGTGGLAVLALTWGDVDSATALAIGGALALTQPRAVGPAA